MIASKTITGIIAIMMIGLCLIVMVPGGASAEGYADGITLAPGDHIVIPASTVPLRNFSVDAITMELLFTLLDNSGTTQLIGHYDDEIGKRYFSVDLESNKLIFKYQGRQATTWGDPFYIERNVTTSWDVDTLYRLSISWNFLTDTILIYKNGVLILTVTATDGMSSIRPYKIYTEQIKIGGTNEVISAIAHDYRVWHAVRTQSEIDTNKFLTLASGPEINLAFDALNQDGYNYVSTEWIEISTLADLDNMRDNVWGRYELINDIDASDTAGWNDGAGWMPIVGFGGRLHGNNHVIDGLFINSGEMYIGLFATTSSTAQISNVILTNVSVNGHWPVGGLVGENKGVVYQSHVSGEVTGSMYVGMIAGMNSGRIIESSCAGYVFGESYLGGIAGMSNVGEFNNSFFIGSIIGESYLGGLVGHVHVSANLIDCFSVADLSDPTKSRGLTGNLNGTVYWSSSYMWYIEGIVTGSSVKGLTNYADLKNESTYVGWDFTGIWAIEENSLPYHIWMGLTSVEAPEPIDPIAPEPEPVIDPEPENETNPPDLSGIYMAASLAVVGVMAVAAIVTRHPLAIVLALAGIAWAVVKFSGVI